MIVPILGAAAAGVAGLLGYAATRPDTLRVQRSATIGAPPERIYPLIADFRRWEAWSPWEKLDPEMKRTLSGADSGVGAVYEWDGNRKAGAGRMEIVEAAEPSEVDIRLDFTRPFESHNTTRFALEPDGSGTRVTWTMDGPQAFMSKVMGVFIDMDGMIGKDFDRGLAAMKDAAEREPRPVA